MSLLEVDGLRKSFKGLVALDGVDLTIDRGEVVGLIGPNGAGKTTMFNCMTGLLEPDGGTVRFGGEDVTGRPSHELANRGLVRTFQNTRELTSMTVAENVKLAAPGHPGERATGVFTQPAAVERHEQETADRAAELLELFDLADLADEYAGNLSGGQRKLLEIARALMLDPDLLLLDEVFAGVNPTLTNEIMAHIQQLNRDGMTFLVIEHEIQSLSELVDRMVVLDQGTDLVSGTPDEVLNDGRVINAYFGGQA
jgi:branched-chain amino acid transport system ATP-binding protein